MTSGTRRVLWRLGSVALFCGLPILLLVLAISNLVDATQASDVAARNRATTAAIVAQLEKHRTRGSTPFDAAALYLASASETRARAEIQERVTALVATAGGRLAQVQLTSTPEQESTGTVAIQLSLDIDNKGLRDLLYAIESGLPLLTVSELSARSNDGQSDERADGKGLLHVDMTVQAAWRKGTG